MLSHNTPCLRHVLKIVVAEMLVSESFEMETNQAEESFMLTANEDNS